MLLASQQPSLFLTILCGVIIASVGILVILFYQETGQFNRTTKNVRPIAHAYAEIVATIANAQKLQDLYCINRKIDELIETYSGIVAKQDLNAFIHDMQDMKVERWYELYDAKKNSATNPMVFS